MVHSCHSATGDGTGKAGRATFFCGGGGGGTRDRTGVCFDTV